MRRLLPALFFVAASALAQPTVVSVTPAAQSVTAPAAEAIALTFDQALDPASLTDASVRVFGRWSGPATGTRSLDAAGTTLRFEPAAPFFAGEWVTVSLSKSVTALDGTPLAGYTFGFWVRAAPASMDLVKTGQLSTRREDEGAIVSYGAYGGDLNHDGWSDLAIPNEASNDLRVFLNEGGTFGAFTVHPLPEASVPSTNDGGDFNGDGLLDLVVGNIGNDRVSVMLGDGAGDFIGEAATPAGHSVRGLCVLDLDMDGHDDLVTANRSADNLTILMGEGDGAFAAPVPLETGGANETSCAVADADGDGIADLFVGALTSREVILLLGDGEGGLAVSASMDVGTPPWMLATGDVDGDGFADVAAAGASGTNAAVVFGDGAGGLAAVTTFASGSFAVAIDLGDLDGDGDLDLLASNYSSGDFHLYENLGGGTFGAPRVFEAVANASCGTFHDFDNDGDLDLTGVDEGADLLYFFANPGQGASIEDEPERAFRFELFPNPAQDVATLRFELETPSFASVQVFDTRGRAVVVFDEQWLGAGPQAIRWSTRGLRNGAYVLRLTAGGRTATRSFVLTR